MDKEPAATLSFSKQIPKGSNNSQVGETTEKPSDSKSEVNLRLEGPRQTCTFKGHRDLWKAFVSFSKREYGSVCHILEPIIIALLTAKVNLGNTQQSQKQPIVIENLNVQRVVQRYRRVYKEKEYVDVVQNVAQLGEYGVCYECGSKFSVHPWLTLSGSRVFLCGHCAKSWVVKGKLEVLPSWKGRRVGYR